MPSVAEAQALLWEDSKRLARVPCTAQFCVNGFTSDDDPRVICKVCGSSGTVPSDLARAVEMAVTRECFMRSEVHTCYQRDDEGRSDATCY